MNKIERMVPLAQLALILPAGLFMVSLILRGLGPMHVEPSRTAQQIILWYSGRIWTLWVLLTLLPLGVLSIGCVVLVSRWANGSAPRRLLASICSNRSTMLIATLTLVSAVILLIVGAHVLMN